MNAPGPESPLSTKEIIEEPIIITSEDETSKENWPKRRASKNATGSSSKAPLRRTHDSLLNSKGGAVWVSSRPTHQEKGLLTQKSVEIWRELGLATKEEYDEFSTYNFFDSGKGTAPKKDVKGKGKVDVEGTGKENVLPEVNEVKEDDSTDDKDATDDDDDATDDDDVPDFQRDDDVREGSDFQWHDDGSDGDSDIDIYEKRLGIKFKDAAASTSAAPVAKSTAPPAVVPTSTANAAPAPAAFADTSPCGKLTSNSPR
ncbi:hypothetical protein HK101_009263 [Irineochytrium annulatum]|nr:hypothetical protein HK101_009263 [Irineochytrium annulatum]